MFIFVCNFSLMCYYVDGDIMDAKKFKMIDEPFICLNCGHKVSTLGYTARDHCPNCLFSLHVDINPGDRKQDCKGLLEPIAVLKFKDSYKIVYKCQKCGMIRKNIMATDDNMDLIIKIMSNPISVE